MSHYYENDPNLDRTETPFTFELNGQSFRVLSSDGVFSKDRLDTGTRILCEYIVEHRAADLGENVLDLGCGIGVIGVILSRFHPCKITGIDPNAQACHLARENYAANHVDGTIMEADHINEALYDSIVLNPPIRTGKTVIYSLFAQAYDHLKEGGTLYIVIRKQHGAQSAVDYLELLGFEVERPLREKGFWVLEAVK